MKVMCRQLEIIRMCCCEQSVNNNAVLDWEAECMRRSILLLRALVIVNIQVSGYIGMHRITISGPETELTHSYAALPRIVKPILEVTQLEIRTDEMITGTMFQIE